MRKISLLICALFSSTMLIAQEKCENDFESIHASLLVYGQFVEYITAARKVESNDRFLKATKAMYHELDTYVKNSADCHLYKNYLQAPLTNILNRNLWAVKINDERSAHVRDYFLVINSASVLFDEYMRYLGQKSIDSMDKKLDGQIKEVNRQLSTIINQKINSLDSILRITANVVNTKADSVYRRVNRSDSSLTQTITNKTDTVSKILTAYGIWYLGGGLHTNHAISLNAAREKEFRFFKNYYLALTSLALFYRQEPQAKGVGAVGHIGVGSSNFALQPVGVIYFDRKFYYSFQTTIYNNGLMISVSYNEVLGGGLSLLIGLREKAFIPRKRKR